MNAEDWDRWFLRRDKPLRRSPNPIIVELASSLPAGRALEIGAGEGRNALWLARQGWHVTAADISRVATERTRGLAAEEDLPIDCVLSDVLELDVAPRTFDLVLMAYMQPDSADRAATFAVAADAVAAGGHLLVVGLDTTDPAATAEQDDWRYTPDRLDGMFPGIELLRCERVSREAQTDRGPVLSIDSLAWGRRPAND